MPSNPDSTCLNFVSEQRQAGGLGLAWLLDTTAVSLPSETYWRQTHIRVRHTWLEKRGNGPGRGHRCAQRFGDDSRHGHFR